MKISATESGRAGHCGAETPETGILPEGFRKSLHQHSSRGKTARERAIKVALDALKDVPDEREEIVAELKAKIERGEYKVDPQDVAEMVIRRSRADNIR